MTQSDMCGDNRFEIIAKYKKRLIDGTNIESSPDEMAVLDSILFRFWQMGWLEDSPWISVEDELPKWHQFVLIYVPTDKPQVQWTRFEGVWDWRAVTHWMELPEPPTAQRRGAEDTP